MCIIHYTVFIRVINRYVKWNTAGKSRVKKNTEQYDKPTQKETEKRRKVTRRRKLGKAGTDRMEGQNVCSG
jgi:hypothetical protein